MLSVEAGTASGKNGAPSPITEISDAHLPTATPAPCKLTPARSFCPPAHCVRAMT
jgi:hypothetical protein